MNATEYINNAIRQTGASRKDLARKMGWNFTQSLTNRLGRNTLSGDEFIKLLDLMNFEIIVREKEGKELKEVKEFHRGVGKRLKKVVCGVKYDTFNADAICHSDETSPMFVELYRNLDGTYFVAQYVNWEGGISTVTPIGEADAAKLMAAIEEGRI